MSNNYMIDGIQFIRDGDKLTSIVSIDYIQSIDRDGNLSVIKWIRRGGNYTSNLSGDLVPGERREISGILEEERSRILKLECSGILEE